MTSTASILEQIRALVEPLTGEERLILIQTIAEIEAPRESYTPPLTERNQQLVREQAARFALSAGERQQVLEGQMTNDTLIQAQQLIDRLTPLDQARLLTYLTSRLVLLVETMPPTTVPSIADNAAAWQEFFRLGDVLTTTDTPETPTLTATLLNMRR